ncbi:uncharacterized protein LOC121053300 [Oryza brachyantha]|uniref:uncharacterized protein LOC121053300 n=1 Tax=Oryza brachyantha TaxID=4533 RepID=UPI001ADD33AA|nr:uncharacterized protein LOC121053300 [Oryza brachyantha]
MEDDDCLWKGILGNGEVASEKKKQQQRGQAPQESGDSALRRAARRLLPCVACLVVAAHVAACAYRAAGDPRELAFVAAAYAMLAALLCCVGRFEALAAAAASAAAAAARERLRLPVWVLSTALTALFSARVAPVMPPPLDALVVAMAVLVAVGGFCLLFLCDAGNVEPDDDDGDDDDDETASDHDEKV